MSPDDLKSFKEWGVPLPTREPHTEDTYENPLSAKLKSVNPHNWRQAGNQLICDTDVGPLVNIIPTSKLLIGEKNGLPIFKDL